MSDDSHDSSDSDDIHEPHDTLARTVFSHVHYAAEEFRCALPAAIVGLGSFCWSTWEKRPWRHI